MVGKVKVMANKNVLRKFMISTSIQLDFTIVLSPES